MAVVPGLALALYINFKDPKETKPLGILFQSVLWGVLSFVISILLGILLHNISEIEPKNLADQMIRALIFVGFVEEGSKFLFIRGILFRSKHFYKPFDGIVFSVMVGMGFATAENIVYVLNGDGGTAIVRMFTAVPAHAIFGVIMGYFIGEAKVFKSSSGLFSFMGLFFASFAHGYYDFFLFLSFIPGIWLQAIISLFIIVIITHYIFRIRKDEIINPD
jgi:RsiW-degrading membrane proteinase PrsW (M82 family)